jgi:hypothetical protein
VELGKIVDVRCKEGNATIDNKQQQASEVKEEVRNQQ